MCVIMILLDAFAQFFDFYNHPEIHFYPFTHLPSIPGRIPQININIHVTTQISNRLLANSSLRVILRRIAINS